MNWTTLHYIMDELLGACGTTGGPGQHSEDNDPFAYQRAAVTLLHLFCRDTKMDFSDYVSQLIRTIILLFTSDDSTILQEAWNALTAVTKTLDASQQMAHVSDVRQAVRFAVSDMRDKRSQLREEVNLDEITLPGFCLPKGIQPILPIFRESVLNGAPELKEQAVLEKQAKAHLEEELRAEIEEKQFTKPSGKMAKDQKPSVCNVHVA